MMCKLVLVTLVVYLCLEAAYGQHSYGLNPGQRHATGFNPNQNQRHATGFNPGRRTGRVYRDLSSADTGRDHPKPIGAHATGPSRHGFERGPGPVIRHHE